MITNEFKEIVEFHKEKYRSSDKFWEGLIRELEYKGFLTTDEQVEVTEEFLGYDPREKMPPCNKNVELKIKGYSEYYEGFLRSDRTHFQVLSVLIIHKDNVEYWRPLK